MSLFCVLVKIRQFSGLMVSVPASGLSCADSRAKSWLWTLCCLLGKTLYTITLTVPLSTQVYKWVPVNLMLGVALRWTSIPSRWGR